MLSKRTGPGALAGAAEANSGCFRDALHTSFEPPAQLACDGQTKLGQAFRAFSHSLIASGRSVCCASFDRRMVYLGIYTNKLGTPGFRPKALMLALMTRGSTDKLTAQIIEQMGWGAHLIILSEGGGRLVPFLPSGFRNVEAGQRFSQSIAELHPNDCLLVRLRDLAALPIEPTARLLCIDHRDTLARLHCHWLGGLFIDGTPFVSRLHLGRLGVLAPGRRRMTPDQCTATELPIDAAGSDRCLVASQRDTVPESEVRPSLGLTAATRRRAALSNRGRGGRFLQQ